MIDYEKKYKDYTVGIFQCIPDVSQEYPDCDGFEKCVIAFRKEGWTYGQIQTKLGMPSKKQIRQVLLTWAPELIDNSTNKKQSDCSEVESELYTMISKGKQNIFNVFGDLWSFYIQDKQLRYRNAMEDCAFRDWDVNTQAQILDEIKEQLNGR